VYEIPAPPADNPLYGRKLFVGAQSCRGSLNLYTCDMSDSSKCAGGANRPGPTNYDATASLQAPNGQGGIVISEITVETFLGVQASDSAGSSPQFEVQVVGQGATQLVAQPGGLNINYIEQGSGAQPDLLFSAAFSPP